MNLPEDPVILLSVITHVSGTTTAHLMSCAMITI